MKNLEFKMMVVAVDLSPVDNAVGVIKARKLGEINTDSKEEASKLFEEFKKQAGENEIVQLYDTQKIAECCSSHKLSGFAANDFVAYTDDNEHDFNILVIGCRDNEWHMDGSSIYDVLEEIHTNDYEKMTKRVDYIIENQCQLYNNHTLHFIEEESCEMARFDDETQTLYTDDYEIWDSENREIITNR